MRDLVQRVPKRNVDRDEFMLYDALVESANVLGDDWPSKLRNVVNYRPGFAYGFHSSKVDLGMVPPLDFLDEEWKTVLNGMSARLGAIRSGGRGEWDAPVRIAGAACAVARLIFMVSYELHAEVAERVGGDKRFAALRNEFVKKIGVCV
jgi:hypothetical protein